MGEIGRLYWGRDSNLLVNFANLVFNNEGNMMPLSDYHLREFFKENCPKNFLTLKKLNKNSNLLSNDFSNVFSLQITCNNIIRMFFNSFN